MVVLLAVGAVLLWLHKGTFYFSLPLSPAFGLFHLSMKFACISAGRLLKG
jgi:hypothetical protein